MKYLGDHFPSGITKYNEPFLGGGSVALWVTKNYPDANIWVNDLYENLYLFWKTLQTDAVSMQKYLIDVKTKCGNDKQIGSETYKLYRETINDQDDFTRACWFYVLNKMSFSGLGESSSFSHQALQQNFTIKGINTLHEYSNLIQKWKITNLDWKELMADDAFVFLDPPYEIKSGLYGKNGDHHITFDHNEFAKVCNGCSANQMITYNSEQKIIDRFPSWKAVSWDLTYMMRNNSDKYQKEQKGRQELILTNYRNENTLERFL